MRTFFSCLACLAIAACDGETITTPPPGIETPAGLPAPVLPATAFAYRVATNPLPAHFLTPAPGGSVVATDNTPVSNPITDAGATLGRVLFYDVRLSANNTVSCGSCHQQALGFADTARFSRGFAGALTARHTSGLSNARFYANGRFFWDERATTLEAQVLVPIQDADEMGMTLDSLERKLAATSFYAPLFQAAFGTATVTRTRVSNALAQFVRALVSANSRYDQAFQGGPTANFAAVLTAQEVQGEQLFRGAAGCNRCHVTNAQVANGVHNIGLDLVTVDSGAGRGRFKAPSLRNVGVRGRFMHDGRFTSLRQVVDHYDNGVRDTPDLDPLLRTPAGGPQRLQLSPAQRDAIVAYLNSLTDPTFLIAAKFSNPFRR